MVASTLNKVARPKPIKAVGTMVSKITQSFRLILCMAGEQSLLLNKRTHGKTSVKYTF